MLQDIGSKMDGLGSRLGRASSRYGPATTVFTGPVRKWRKMWVRSPSSTLSSSAAHSPSGVHKLLLCRWTPVPTVSPSSAAEPDAAPEEEPPRRKFRYTPISVVEEQKNAAVKKIEDGEGKRRAAMAEKPEIDLVFEEETTMVSTKKLIRLNDSNESDLDLGLRLNAKPGSLGSVG